MSEASEISSYLLQEEKKHISPSPLLPSFDASWYQQEEEAGCFAPCSIINGTEARAIADTLFDEHNHIDEPSLKQAIAQVEKHTFSLGTGAEELIRRRQKILSSLLFLQQNAQAKMLIHRLGRPSGNKIAEAAIRQTLLLEEGVNITELETRKAVIVALLGTLRQSLGSCFATAPAILVHEHQPMTFLENIEELFSTLRLKKVVSGQELIVPQNMGWGEGDLVKPIYLLRKKESNPTPFWRSKIIQEALVTVGLISNLPSSDEEAYILFVPALDMLSQKNTQFIQLKDLLLSLILLNENVLTSEYQQFLLKNNVSLFHQEVERTNKETSGPFAAKMKVCRRVQERYTRLTQYLTSRTDIALLKMWEYTVASFAEVKLGMCKNNFFISLGVNWNDEGGIGSIIYEAAKQRVDEANQLVEESQREYDRLNAELTLLNQRLQTASTDQELQWLKVEHQTRQVEQYNLRQQCEIAVERANKIAHLHELLLEQYDLLLKEYFQEIYDPDLHEVQTGPYDDSPAGFRLLYKHGRSNSALWTLIRSLDEWRDALASFFSITEQELLLLPELASVEGDVRHIISRLVQHIRSDEFVEKALKRYSEAYNVPCPESPLQNLDKLQKKPWVYTSGGSMNSLVEAYFSLEKPPEEHARWVEHETELLAYLIDTVRLVQKRMARSLPQKMLMHSPTHAFLLLPHHSSFQESWQSDAYSYTWIKKTIEEPSQSFYSSHSFTPETTEAINEALAQFLNPNDWLYLRKELSVVPNFLRCYEYVREVQHIFQIETFLRPYADRLELFNWDQFFFSNLPYLTNDQIKPLLIKIVHTVTQRKNNSHHLLEEIPLNRKVYSKQSWLSLLKIALMETCKHEEVAKNLLEESLQIAQTLIEMPSRPVIFADTNWMKEYFAFATSPVSLALRLWTCSSLGTEGSPISAWTPWLNGSRKDRTWGILTNPEDYSMKQTLSMLQQGPGKLQYYR